MQSVKLCQNNVTFLVDTISTALCCVTSCNDCVCLVFVCLQSPVEDTAVSSEESEVNSDQGSQSSALGSLTHPGMMAMMMILVIMTSSSSSSNLVLAPRAALRKLHLLWGRGLATAR